MKILESVDELNVFTCKAIIKICAYNRDIFVAYNRKCREDLYKIFNEYLKNGMRIRIPLMQREDYMKYLYINI